ncbi:MAG: hypothetical protein AABZ30_14695 [Myxococcota bacterium]
MISYEDLAEALARWKAAQVALQQAPSAPSESGPVGASPRSTGGDEAATDPTSQEIGLNDIVGSGGHATE